MYIQQSLLFLFDIIVYFARVHRVAFEGKTVTQKTLMNVCFFIPLFLFFFSFTFALFLFFIFFLRYILFISFYLRVSICPASSTSPFTSLMIYIQARKGQAELLDDMTLFFPLCSTGPTTFSFYNIYVFRVYIHMCVCVNVYVNRQKLCIFFFLTVLFLFRFLSPLLTLMQHKKKTPTVYSAPSSSNIQIKHGRKKKKTSK